MHMSSKHNKTFVVLNVNNVINLKPNILFTYIKIQLCLKVIIIFKKHITHEISQQLDN